jgi:hypothetical protein
MKQETINRAMKALAKRKRGPRSPAAAEQSRRAGKAGAAARWAKKIENK